jgi:putative AdoMet-dependent methyltransferase
MNREPRIHLFDEWAEHYDQSIRSDCGFPFDGYEQVLDEIVRAAGAQCGMKVLDLGIGTGNVADRFAAIGCDIWGIDFSAEMLAKTTEKLPKAVLVQADLMNEWPTELDQRFDRIVSAYVLHEFGFSAKMKLLQRLTRGHLGQNGRIVVGDIAFPTSRIRDGAHRKWTELWDEEEYYWAADEIVEACKSIGLQVTYKQISSCGGVFVFESVGSGQACTPT